MRRRRILASTFVLAVFAASSFAAPDGDAPRVELPLGPYVRPGRPLDVRVVGGADRVRAPGTPWALPQGARGDEFVLQLTEATSQVLTLEIDRGGRVERVTTPVEPLPRDGRVVGVRSEGGDRKDARVLRISDALQPTVPEGWLLLDAVEDREEEAPGRELLEALRRLEPALRPFREPMLLAPDAAAFSSFAQVAAAAPRLPGDVAVLLGLLAAAEIVLIVVLRSRDATPWRRAAWLGLPPLAALAFVAAPGRLPGALSAAAIAVDGAHGRCVFVRVDARRAGAARFTLPGHAGGAAMVRYSADDATVAGAAAGREVILDLAAGESRVFAYPLHGAGDDGPDPAGRPDASVPQALRAWLAGRGLDVAAGGAPFGGSALPDAQGTVVIPAAGAFVVPPSK